MAEKTQVAKVAATDSDCRMRETYKAEVVPYLMKRFNYKNVNQVPKLVKITINGGLGDVKDDAKKFQAVVEEIALITGQAPIVTKAKKSVANFKVREGMNIGAKVTLRGERMYEFFDRLVSVALPRVRDFQGLSTTSFDGRGNYSFGVKEQIIFPEIIYDKIDAVRGFDIMFITTAKSNEEALELLKLMGIPFKKVK